MRILVVEDYAAVRKAVVQALREEHYSVDDAEDGQTGLAMAASGEYDLVVLDLMLPGMSGNEILRTLRAGGESCHVLVLTARDSLDDRIAGLDLGADDYLVKPFAMEELLARVRALIRRSYTKKSATIEIGHLEIRTSDHIVLVDGEQVEMTAKEYALLEYLAYRAGEVVTRTEIWRHIYDDQSSATSNVVDVYIGYLRKKIDRPGHPKLLQTKRGEGYILAEKLT